MAEEYWTVSEGLAVRNGNKCRECKQYIMINEPIAIRDGRKIRLFYHKNCYSGSPDPRTQPRGSYTQKFSSVLSPSAPKEKGHGKWSCNSYGYNPDYQVLNKVRTNTETQKTLKNSKEKVKL